ncbi:MAG: ABC transporter ATP-binding protein [Sphaerochaeta sp.]|uniref:ABC transporter ATP-binding protein n=1 Tax=Sphaerochaeta sp. TaxID=1972642 RepID=UPI003D0FC6B9
MDGTDMAQIEIPRLGAPKVGGASRFASHAKAKDMKGTLKRLLHLFLGYRRTWIATLFLSILSTALTVGIPYGVGQVFNTFHEADHQVDIPRFQTLIAALLVFSAANALVTMLSHSMILKASQHLVKALRTRFFAKLQHLDLAFFDTNSSGDTMSRLVNDVDLISQSIATSAVQLLESILTILGSLSVMFFLNIVLSVSVLLCVPFVFLVTRFIAKKSRAFFLEQQQNLGKINALVEESIQNLQTIKAFSKEADFDTVFTQTNERLRVAGTSAQLYSGLLMPLMNVLNNFTFAVVAIISGVLCTNSGLLIGTAITFLTYSKRFASPLNQVAGLFNTIQSALAGAERVFEILDKSEQIPDEPNAVDLANARGNVEFKHVSFSYDKHKQVLTDINFTAKAGQVIALVGETGSGKTTIVNLLTRFYDVDSGEILLDGVTLTHIKRSSLKHCFTVVLQEPCLFTSTIAETIRYAKPEASDAQVMQAARLVRADQCIEKLPNGYRSMISANNQSLSQGEKQLLAIARAVLSDSPILILDEATSSVDTKTEKEIQKALTTLMAGRTSFLIAHRLSTVKDADLILVISEGRICERGTHSSLLAQRGLYYDMVSSQNGPEDAEPLGVGFPGKSLAQ